MKIIKHPESIPLFILLLLLFCSISVHAQIIKVQGTVTDAITKEPLPGVNVITSDKKGTVTNLDGYFTIQVEKGKPLTFSYVGYQDFIISKISKSIYHINMQEDNKELEDVVVLGTRIKKSDLTGAIGSISEKQLKEVPTSNFTAAMQGKVAGVLITSASKPGDSPQIKVRGTNSINYGRDPIYVVDGMVVSDGISGINPNDIASIEVLKDASAKAIYGYRAANGVILVSTKKGQSGKGVVKYDGWVGFSSFDRGNMKTLGAKDLYNLRIDAWVNQYKSQNPNITESEISDYINNTLLADESVSGHIFSNEERSNGQNDITSDWLSPITRNGFEQNHSLSFSGGSNSNTYFLGFSYTDQKGVLVNSNYKRYNAKINLQQKVKSWLEVGTNTMFYRAITKRMDNNLYNSCLQGNPLQTIDNRAYMYWNGGHDSSGNPLNLMDIRREQTHDCLISSNYININPIKNLNIRTTLSINYINKQDYNFTPSTANEDASNDKGIASHWKGIGLNTQWDNSISYEYVTGKHRIFAMLTSSMNKYETNANYIQVKGFPSDILGWYNLGASYSKEKNNYSSEWTSQSAVSFVQRVNYSYDSRHMLTVSLREDGSSRFADGKRWGYFPSFSYAWNISEEGFMKDIPYLSQLKLRLGWGLVGNQDIPNYAFLTIFNPVYSNGSTSFISDGRMGNTNVSWEKQNQYNIGLDFSVWNDRLSFSADYFYTINSDLLMSKSLSPTMGFNNRIDNVAKLENKGIEFSANAQLINKRNWKWNLSANISHDKNTVKALYDNLQVIWSGNSITSRENNLFVGQPVNTYYAMKVEKIAQQSDMERISEMTFVGNKIVQPGDILPVDKNGDGKIRYEDDLFVIGRKDPKFYGGFSSNLSWKNLTLSSSFSYSVGARRYSWQYERLMNLGSWEFASHRDALNRWTPEHTDTSVPRAFRGGSKQRFGIGETDFVLLDASYLKCSALTLSYDLPKSWLEKTAESVKVYFTANNLFTITPYKGYDPESGEDYPSSKMFVFGVNMSF